MSTDIGRKRSIIPDALYLLLSAGYRGQRLPGRGGPGRGAPRRRTSAERTSDWLKLHPLLARDYEP
ncbi:hypothetical protein [Streptomyces sp. 900105245]